MRERRTCSGRHLGVREPPLPVDVFGRVELDEQMIQPLRQDVRDVRHEPIA